jgi:shikimate kinase
VSKIIELCGIPGVGKSTVYSVLVSSWNKKDKWIPADFLYPKQKIDLKSPRNLISLFAGRIKGNLDLSELNETGKRFVSEYPKYMNHSWDAMQRKHSNSKNAPDERFKEVKRLKRSAEYIRYLIENKCPQFAIVDIGGLVQRLDLTWNTSQNISEDHMEAVHLLNSMPLPGAVVYLHIDLDRNVERLLNRNKTLARHKNLSAKELEDFCKKYEERWEIILNLLMDRKVPVLKIKADVPVMRIVEQIKEFVDGLYENASMLETS